MSFASLFIAAIERGYVPDAITRIAIRKLLAERLESEQQRLAERERWIEQLSEGPIAIDTDKSKEQHYELPPPYFEKVLGPHLKYSSCYWPDEATSLDEAEAHMLKLSCERAQLEDGQDILELGCGWGSLSLWMAEHYPNANITAVSHAVSQRAFIEAKALSRNLTNLKVITADMREFDIDQSFDRVVSVEMFEHMRNYELLMQRISTWLKPGGKLFVHIFTHKSYAYPFEDEGDDSWMARHFFTGGTMPSDNLLTRYQQHLSLDKMWTVNGTHYQKTLEAWLKKQDQAKNEITAIFEQTYGKKNTKTWQNRWRLFYLSCAELFGYADGEEWRVCHYRFMKE